MVRVRFDAAGAPVATEDFLTGFLIDPRTGPPANPAAPDRPAQFGRLAGIGVWTDGSLLVGDDQNGVIYRITYAGGTPTAADAPGRAVAEAPAPAAPRDVVGAGSAGRDDRGRRARDAGRRRRPRGRAPRISPASPTAPCASRCR